MFKNMISYLILTLIAKTLRNQYVHLCCCYGASSLGRKNIFEPTNVSALVQQQISKFYKRFKDQLLQKSTLIDGMRFTYKFILILFSTPIYTFLCPSGHFALSSRRHL